MHAGVYVTKVWIFTPMPLSASKEAFMGRKDASTLPQVVPSIGITTLPTAAAVGVTAVAFGTYSLPGLSRNTLYTYSVQSDTGAASSGCADLATSDANGSLPPVLPIRGFSRVYYAIGNKTATLSVYTKASCCCGTQPTASSVLVARGSAPLVVRKLAYVCVAVHVPVPRMAAGKQLATGVHVSFLVEHRPERFVGNSYEPRPDPTASIVLSAGSASGCSHPLNSHCHSDGHRR